ncbi:MAG: OmpH family outer membrane protein [Paracoccaceae bacterium]|nr:MAG: OmpH family outer membrane protein [Paracoccaceae bacterium]
MRVAGAAVAVLLAAAPGAVAQTAPGDAPAAVPLSPGSEQAPVLVLRQEEFFERSAFGRASLDRRESASRALIAENRQIEAALEAEERALTARRPTLPPDEFRALAEAFNDKVEQIRTAQDAKARAVARLRDEDRGRFLQAAVPVLAEIMSERGGLVILDQQVVVLSFDRVDITDEAVARVDARIGAGDLADPVLPDPAPQPPGTPDAAPSPSQDAP